MSIYNLMVVDIALKLPIMDEMGAFCLLCGTWHYELLCPKCGSSLKTKRYVI